MPTETGVDTVADTIQIEVRCNEHLFRPNFQVSELVDIFEGLEGLITTCVPIGSPDPVVQIKAQNANQVAKLNRRPHRIVVGRINYNSPLEILFLVSASVSVLTATTVSLLKVAERFDRWKLTHAEAKFGVKLFDYQTDLLKDLSSKTGKAHIRTFGAESEEVKKLNRQINEALNYVASIRIIPPNSNNKD